MARLRIINPCPESWAAMSPRDQGRHCDSCDRVVYDAVSMTRGELTLLLEREPAPCLRVAILPDGTPVTLDHPRVFRVPHRAAALATAVAAAALACNPLSEPAQKQAALPVAQQPEAAAADPVCTKPMAESELAEKLKPGEQSTITPEMLQKLAQLGYVLQDRE